MELREIGKETFSGCKAMREREKITVDDIIQKHEKITVISYDYILTGGKVVPVINIKEEPEKFFFGGAAFKTLFEAWEKSYSTSHDDDDVVKGINSELKDCDGVKIKLEKVPTLKGAPYTKIAVL